MDTLDEIARRSAARVRDEARSVADTEGALRDLTAGVTLATVSPVRSAASARRWWLGAAAAAAVAGLIGGGAVVLTRDEPGRVAPSNPSLVDTVPTAPGAVRMLTEADAEVLFTATMGAGVDQLGVRDELRPLAPIVTADGALIIGDPVNSRWIVVRDGVPASVADDESEFVWDTVLGVEGTVYSLVYTWSNKGLVNGRVEYAQPDALDAVTAYPTDVGTCCSRLVYDGSLERGATGHVGPGDGVVVVVESAGSPTVLPEQPTDGSLAVSYPDGTVRHWPGFAADVLSGRIDMTPLPDGSLVGITIQPSAARMTWWISHLRLDGTVASETIGLDAAPADNIGKWSVGSDGLTVLTRSADGGTFRVLRFPLPQGTSTPPVATEPEVTVSTIVVPDTTQAPPAGGTLQATVLYEATVGSGDGQLGVEDCAECEPQAPLAPIVAPDGTVIIGDTFNRRWVVVATDGSTRYVPYAADSFVYDAVLGSDGNIYRVSYVMHDGTKPEAMSIGPVEYSPYDDLTATTEMAYEGVAGISLCCRSISFDGSGEPAVEDPTITLDSQGQFLVRHGHFAPTVTAALDADVTTVTATYIDGTTREWTLGAPGLVPSLPTLHVLDDGSIVAVQVSPLSQEARIVHTVNHLHLDGTVATGNLPVGVTTAGTLGKWSVDANGVTTMTVDESTGTFQVVRYALPD